MKTLSKLLLILILLVGAVYLFKDKIPFINNVPTTMDSPTVSNELLPIFKEFEKAVGVTFSDPYETSFDWFTGDDDSVIRKKINGTGIKAAMIKDIINTFDFLESKGYMFSRNNIADGTISSLEGFQNGNSVCVIIKTINGELNEDGVIEGDVFTDVEIQCGGLKSLEPTLLINTNENSDLAMLSVNENGVGVKVYTKKTSTGEIVDYFVIEDQENSVIRINVDEDGIMNELKFDGYTLSYSNFTGSSIDLTVTYSDGTSKTEKGISIGENFSWIPSAYAKSNEDGNREDHSDGKYYTDVAGNAWNTIVCVGGLATNLLPNPVSTSIIVMGCGTLFSRAIPANIVIDDCGDKSIFDCVTSVLAQKKSALYLDGAISSNDGEHLLPNVDILMTHKNGKYINEKTELYGLYSIPLDVNGLYTIDISKDEFVPRKFTMAVSNDRVKIIDSDEKTLYDQKRAVTNLPAFNFSLTLNDTLEQLEKEKGGLIMKLSPTTTTTENCKGWKFDFGIKLVIDDDGKVIGKEPCDDVKKCPILPVKGIIKNNKFIGELDMLFSGQLILEGSLGPSGGSGTWREGGSVINGVIHEKYENIDPTERHHIKELCRGTWGAALQ